MGKTNKERILDYLWSISPETATNAQIRDATGISSHQVVYMLTQELQRKGKIQGEKRGREWFFWADDSLAQQLFSPGRVSSDAEAEEVPQEFKRIAQSVMSWHFEVDLEAGTVPGVVKEFDMVSSDRDVVGDARYFAPVRGHRLPMVFSTITENVWVLEKTGASFPFLVFGNDRQVPLLWLERYGQLVESVGFYFIDDDGQLEDLFEPPTWDEPNPLFDSNEWDQRRATWRSIDTMRRIARDAMKLEDHGFYTYAREHDIPVNEIVYYLNAYEAGGDVGLKAIRNPDIIPPDVARRAVKEITRTLDARFEGHSLRYRVTDEGTAIGVYQVQERANGEEFLFRICQFRLTLEGMKWHLYWMRKFDAWWPYSLPRRGRRFTLRARLQQVLEDEYGCFWV
jgi:hypothetical protein